jgi:hypothetical protein
MPLPPEELFDSDDERPQIWHKNEWIGTGKKYPSGDTPGYILRARHELLCIPHPYATYIPDHRMSINDFLVTNLPPLSSALVVTRAEDAYSQLEPNTDLRCLATRPIPSVDWLAKLDAAFGQAWFDGRRSIIDSRYKDSRLPLWTIQFWKDMVEAVKKRAMWQASDEWIAKNMKDAASMKDGEAAREIMGTLSRGTPLRALGSLTTMDTLTILLSEHWFDDEIMNMLLANIAARIRSDPKLADVVVAPISFHLRLRDGFKKKCYGKEAVTELHRYKAYVDGGKTILYMSANVRECHWVPFRVDFRKREFSYGMMNGCLSFMRSNCII